MVLNEGQGLEESQGLRGKRNTEIKKKKFILESRM